MPKITILPNPDYCPEGATFEAPNGISICRAALDNGIKIQVPPFVEAEDDIILDTRTLEYVKKI